MGRKVILIILFFFFVEGKEKVLMSKKVGGGMAVGGGGGEGWQFFGALEFLSLTCAPVLCSSSFHSNSPLMEELLLQRRWNGWRRRQQVRGHWGCKGPRKGGGGDEIRFSVNGGTVVKGPSRVTVTLKETLAKLLQRAARPPTRPRGSGPEQQFESRRHSKTIWSRRGSISANILLKTNAHVVRS